MDTFYKAWEYVTNICEPLMLWLLLRSTLPQKGFKRILSIVVIFVLAGLTTLINIAEWPYAPVILLALLAYCGYSLLFFEGEPHLRVFLGNSDAVYYRFRQCDHGRDPNVAPCCNG